MLDMKCLLPIIPRLLNPVCACAVPQITKHHNNLHCTFTYQAKLHLPVTRSVSFVSYWYTFRSCCYTHWTLHRPIDSPRHLPVASHWDLELAFAISCLQEVRRLSYLYFFSVHQVIVYSAFRPLYFLVLTRVTTRISLKIGTALGEYRSAISAGLRSITLSVYL